MPLGRASDMTRPVNPPAPDVRKFRSRAIVMPTSALLTGSGSTYPDLKSGPIAAMKFMVSPRLKLPCMPWPCRSTVSAIWTEQLVGSSQPDDQERKLTTIDGGGWQ